MAQILKTIIRKANTLTKRPIHSVRSKFHAGNRQKAENYLSNNGVLDIISTGTQNEEKPDYFDLSVLHKSIIKMKPKVVLEFGSGNSTLVMLHALNTNQKGRLYELVLNNRTGC